MFARVRAYLENGRPNLLQLPGSSLGRVQQIFYLRFSCRSSRLRLQNGVRFRLFLLRDSLGAVQPNLLF
jgi:hypothetical protein